MLSQLPPDLLEDEVEKPHDPDGKVGGWGKRRFGLSAAPALLCCTPRMQTRCSQAPRARGTDAVVQ